MKIKYFLIILSLFLLTGCYNYIELDDLTITTGLGVDKTGDSFKLTAQVVNTIKVGSEGTSSYPQITTYSAEAKTIQEAIRLMFLESSKKLYFNQLQIIIIGETVARDDTQNMMDLFFRSIETRKRFYVLVTHNAKAEDILTTLTPLDNLVSSNIEKSLLTESNFLGISKLVTFEDLMSDYLNDNVEISLPSIILKGDVEGGKDIENLELSEPNTKILLSTTAIFKEGKLLDYLTKEESIALNFIKNNIKSTVISYECDLGKQVVIKIINSKTKMSPSKKDLKIKITIKGIANLAEIHCDLNIEKDKVIKDIQKKANKEIEKLIKGAITKIKDGYNSDVFGFLDLFYKNSYPYYKTIKDDWYDDNFKNLEIEVESKIKLIGKGNILRAVKNEK